MYVCGYKNQKNGGAGGKCDKINWPKLNAAHVFLITLPTDNRLGSVTSDSGKDSPPNSQLPSHHHSNGVSKVKTEIRKS